MVGGQSSAFSTAKAVLDHMGKNIVHCGPCGTGQVRSYSTLKQEISIFFILLFIEAGCLG